MAHLPVELCGVLGFACDDSGFFAFDPFAHLQDGLTASVSRSMLALFWGVQNVDVRVVEIAVLKKLDETPLARFLAAERTVDALADVTVEQIPTETPLNDGAD